MKLSLACSFLVFFTVSEAALNARIKKLIVDLHNQYRTEIGVPKVKWDKNLEAFAQETSNKLAKKCGDLKHTSTASRKNIPGWKDQCAGENLSGGMHSQWGKRDQLKMVEHGVNWWYDEKKYYDYTANTCKAGKMCGHYTQLVWDASRVIGCGFVFCPKTKHPAYRLACNYEARGNVNGKRPYGREKYNNCTPGTTEKKLAGGTRVTTEITCPGECIITKTTTTDKSGSWKSITRTQC